MNALILLGWPVLGNYAHYSEVLFILSIFLMHLFEHLMVLYLSGSESMPHLQTIEITEKETANSHKNEFSRNNAILGDAAVLELKTDCTYKNTTDSDDIVRQKGLGSGANSGHGHGLRLLDSKRKRDISSYILEFSVSFHSVIVGLTVGMTSESTAKLLAIALSFHQFFEGIAMGERLVDLYSNSKKHKLMFVGAAVYMFSTPLGQVIGMSIHSSFAPRSPSSLIVLGFMEAICSGILLYSSVVDLILPEFSSRDFLEMRNWRKICCFLSMYLGTAGMSIVGHWA
ncbi:Fe(2+) transport protein 2 [Zancudomyces culisetae]|uniref:Fe(2+) transport protein 2 n=1 Tax=Zancudomyces culisetae TaxID=1213189 RepID=A0A1R1PI54_ZANCU|nr:Fe(2+) transport protein 2 [Zancudomyces culisetae]OMH80609.1 Fe(2+) transport protein 2 [Zancudomyces culisetae]|eukprot:OMH79428.1 Fe(2+) transport protein 2 [Zancudomyces culisetae]